MDPLFYFAVPTNAFYKNPYSKDAIFVAFDLSKRKLHYQKISLKDGHRLLERKTFFASEEDTNALLERLSKEEDFFLSYLDVYETKEGAWYTHGFFNYKGKEVRLPDYISNFEAYDIFHRYAYYPDQERVRFYRIVREIYRFAFKAMGGHEDLALFEKVPTAVKDGTISVMLEKDDFEPLGR